MLFQETTIQHWYINYSIKRFPLRLVFSCLIILCISCSEHSSEQSGTLLVKISSDKTGIRFRNDLKETEDFNIIEYLYFYNGGGVAIGDINADSLPDLYFSSNQSPNRLYLNKGNFHFEDITESAGVSAEGNWKTGVAMADINADGWLDIFSCGVGDYKKFNGRNQVFINQHDNTFKESSVELGLSFQGFSTQVAFLDYDQDGDVDIYLLNHSVHSTRSYGDVTSRNYFDEKSGDRLYENQLVQTGKTFFKAVTQEAGIYSSAVGYGLGVGVSDLNDDGWPDIYVSNDFHENDYIYLNNRNKTFRQVAESAMGHTSRFSMGNDIADINNDGLFDIVTTDMLPKDEAVRKASAGEDSYEIFQYKLRFGFHNQLARNALQLNRGIDNYGIPHFSDVAMMSETESTDWSWAPLIADFNDDGYKDLFITNGIRRRPNDMDYISFISNDSVQRYAKYSEFLEKMPDGKASNYLFKNAGGYMLRDSTEKWLKEKPGFSNGASYGDLDNDGDLDLVVNNLNDEPSIYENKLVAKSSLNIKLQGSSSNPFGIGAKVIVYSSTSVQVQEVYPTRGWQSSIDYKLHFGLGDKKIDSVKIIWPGSFVQTVTNVNGSYIKLNFSDAQFREKSIITVNDEPKQAPSLLTYKHTEDEFSDFAEELLVPHSLASQGPKMAIGDLNRDDLDDIVIGGATNQSTSVFIQTINGGYVKRKFESLEFDNRYEDAGISILDLNGDKLLDLIIANGVNKDSSLTGIRLYLGTKQGDFKRHETPHINSFISCIKPIDFDRDGDLDLFVGGRKVPNQYGIIPESHLLINDGKGRLMDSNGILPKDGLLGMVTDASWVDVNSDDEPDLILSGEWMPITVLLQKNKALTDYTTSFGLDKTNGWWNCLKIGDVDRDGDLDLLTGNLGLNSRLKASPEWPVAMYVLDIDNNGSNEQIITYRNGELTYPFISRDQFVKQVPSFKKKFLRFKDFKSIALEDIIPTTLQNRVVTHKAYQYSSMFFRNDGQKYSAIPLPIEFQMAPIFAMELSDINFDGNIDLIAGGNLYAVQPELGQYDAGFPIISFGNGMGQFVVQQINNGQFFRNEIRDIKVIESSKNGVTVLFTINNGAIREINFQPKRNK